MRPSSAINHSIRSFLRCQSNHFSTSSDGLRKGGTKRAQFTVIKEVNVLRTNHPTVFTMAPYDPVLPLEDYQNPKKQIFSCASCFVSPKDLKFSLPREEKAEIAFIGRSNVGKSSLVDHLLSTSAQGLGLVRVSKQPGCTKTINFFTFLRGTKGSANNAAVVEEMMKNTTLHDTSKHIAYLVDIPGYGFARANKQEQERWQNVLESYLLVRNQSILRRIFVLVDSRHGIKDSDIEMMNLLNDHRIPYQLVMTKIDLVKESHLLGKVYQAFEVLLKMRNNTCFPFIHTVSAHKNIGIDTLKLNMAEIISQKWSSSANEWLNDS